MLLSQLLHEYCIIPAEMDKEVLHLALNSHDCSPGSVFIAVKGTKVDGRDFIPAAIEKGAEVILLEHSHNVLLPAEDGRLIHVGINNLAQQAGKIAAAFYQHPSNQLAVTGVTGTNGKTTCVYFLAQILTQLAKPCGLIGTLGHGFYGAVKEAGLTTPDAISLQRILHTFVTDDAQAVAMEVSSHSVHQARINGIDFCCAIFTNLTQDHLDYHGTMDAYAEEKYRFLAQTETKMAVINIDDAYAQQWLPKLQQLKPVYTYCTCLHEQQHATLPNSYCTHIESTSNGMQAQVVTPWGKTAIFIPLLGQFNLSNALAVITALGAQGYVLSDIVSALKNIHAAPGRMQAIHHSGQPLVVVDYAHTPDALQKTLQSLRSHQQGKLICVFGCGGDRDKAKRPLMAAAAERYADLVIVTDDNPRHENPDDIINDILQGFKQGEKVVVERNRSKAIQKSIEYSTSADCVLIAGKGAECYQQIGDKKLPFNDLHEVETYCRLRPQAECD